jgi:hypothetical protein
LSKNKRGFGPINQPNQDKIMQKLSTPANQARIRAIVAQWNAQPRQIRGNSSPWAAMEQKGGQWIFYVKGDMVQGNGPEPHKEVNLWKHGYQY